LLACHLEGNRNPSIAPSRRQSMIPKSGSRFSEKIMLKQNATPAATCRGID
jgi:hypothetical protein